MKSLLPVLILISLIIFCNGTKHQIRPSLQSTLVAEHSRKTHQDYRTQYGSGEDSFSLENILKSIENSHNIRESDSVFEGIYKQPNPPDFHRKHKAFEGPDDVLAIPTERTNPFQLPSFDENFKTHSICEEWNSGGQENKVNLEYTESADRLLKIIGNGVVKNGYNMFMAPGQSQKPRVTTNVSVAVYIESISSFRAQTMDYEVDMYLAMGWYDRRLAHNCTHPILVTHKFISDRIWQPDLYFVNSKFAYLQEVTTPNFMLIVYPDGLIFKSMRIDVTLSCMMDLKKFPIDKQECPMVIQSYAYVENLLNLSWHVDPPNFPIGSNAEIKLNDMVITSTAYEKCDGPYPMFRGYGNWSCVKGFIVMKRLIVFHVIQTYVPTAIPISSSPSLQDGKEMKKRPESPIIGLSTGTPLLHSNGNAAAIHGNGCYLRQRHASMDSGHSRLCQQNSNFSVTAGCVNSTTALMAGNNTNPTWASKFDTTKPCQKCAYDNEMTARKIDQYSRIIFPVAFTIFCLSYWLYYLSFENQ
uniref:Neurotransmitter-gated ion-channel ligand-binding domain-containing protein n=1 Tax=Panagrolaimus sp. JU765 TaxID=591449 RepID=A0AC34RTM4_9BILA